MSYMEVNHDLYIPDIMRDSMQYSEEYKLMDYIVEFFAYLNTKNRTKVLEIIHQDFPEAFDAAGK